VEVAIQSFSFFRDFFKLCIAAIATRLLTSCKATKKESQRDEPT
jgi:hypothetical protein